MHWLSHLCKLSVEISKRSQGADNFLDGASRTAEELLTEGGRAEVGFGGAV